MKKWLFLILLFPLICVAQTYRYLGVEDGLSNRRVYCIQKDKTGYMWFLTHEGIDRYNGKEFKRYKLMDGDAEVNSLLNLNWLYIDQEGVLWEIGKKGKVFRYDQIHDCFSLVYKLPMESFSEQPDPVTYAWLDQNKHIWLCNKDTIFLYNTDTKQVTHIKNDISEEITDIEQIDESHFFIGTEMGIHYIAGFINIFSPQKIVIGGGLSEAGDFYIQKVSEKARSYAIPDCAVNTQIIAAALGNKAGSIGAASLVFTQLSAPNLIKL